MNENLTLAAGTSDGADVNCRPGVPYGRLVRVEARKLTDTRAGRWLLAAILAATPLAVGITLFAAKPKDLTYDTFVDFTLSPQKILLPVLGILAITSEWSQRTGLVTFTLAPNRLRVLLAKITATLLFGLVAVALSFAVAALGNVLGMAIRGGDGGWAFGLTGFRDITLVQLTGLLEGMAFGMLLLSSAAAIVLYYALPNGWSVLFSIVPALRGARPWLDLNKAQNPLYNHDMAGGAWLRLLVSAGIWIAVPLAFGLVRVLRGEVRSS